MMNPATIMAEERGGKMAKGVDELHRKIVDKEEEPIGTVGNVGAI